MEGAPVENVRGTVCAPVLLTNPSDNEDSLVCCHYCRASRKRFQKRLNFVGCSNCKKTYCIRCITEFHPQLDYTDVERKSDRNYFCQCTIRSTLSHLGKKAVDGWRCSCCKGECCCSYVECPVKKPGHRHCFTHVRTIRRHAEKEGKLAWTKKRKLTNDELNESKSNGLPVMADVVERKRRRLDSAGSTKLAYDFAPDVSPIHSMSPTSLASSVSSPSSPLNSAASSSTNPYLGVQPIPFSLNSTSIAYNGFGLHGVSSQPVMQKFYPLSSYSLGSGSRIGSYQLPPLQPQLAPIHPLSRLPSPPGLQQMSSASHSLLEVPRTSMVSQTSSTSSHHEDEEDSSDLKEFKKMEEIALSPIPTHVQVSSLVHSMNQFHLAHQSKTRHPSDRLFRLEDGADIARILVEMSLLSPHGGIQQAWAPPSHLPRPAPVYPSRGSCTAW